MKPKINEQLSLFDVAIGEVSAKKYKQALTNKDAHTVENKATEPQWDEPFGLAIDLIGNEYLGGFIFRLSLLENESSLYTLPLFRVLMSALVSLRYQKKSWSQKSFTVFSGEITSYDAFYLGFGLGNSSAGSDVLMFLREKLQRMPAFKEFDSGSSDNFAPIFRYDKGFIIEYAEPDLAGTSFFDSDDNYRSNQTIYRRGWQSAEMHGLIKSRYSKLKSR